MDKRERERVKKREREREKERERERERERLRERLCSAFRKQKNNLIAAYVLFKLCSTHRFIIARKS